MLPSRSPDVLGRASPVRLRLPGIPTHRDGEPDMKKKTKQIKLHLACDVVRTLQSHELQQVEGGGNGRAQTGDSKNECCA